MRQTTPGDGFVRFLSVRLALFLVLSGTACQEFLALQLKFLTDKFHCGEAEDRRELLLQVAMIHHDAAVLNNFDPRV